MYFVRVDKFGTLEFSWIPKKFLNGVYGQFRIKTLQASPTQSTTAIVFLGEVSLEKIL